MSEPRDIPPFAPAGELGKRKRRMTARWQYTNRLNARASTGPRTDEGKARVARNAQTHGLSLSAPSDPGFGPEIVELAQRLALSVAGQAVDGERHELACRVAETLIDLRRVRLAKQPLVSEIDADPSHCAKPLAQLGRLDRYERRTLSRRKRVMREFDEAVLPLRAAKVLREIRQNKAMKEKAKDSNETSP